MPKPTPTHWNSYSVLAALVPRPRLHPMKGSNGHREWGVLRKHRAFDRFLGAAIELQTTKTGV
jgi:hypothetical protein